VHGGGSTIESNWGRLIPALESSRRMRLPIVPGNHGDYLGELVAAAGDPGPLRRALPFLVAFLDQPEIATQS